MALAAGRPLAQRAGPPGRRGARASESPGRAGRGRAAGRDGAGEPRAAQVAQRSHAGRAQGRRDPLRSALAGCHAGVGGHRARPQRDQPAPRIARDHRRLARAGPALAHGIRPRGTDGRGTPGHRRGRGPADRRRARPLWPPRLAPGTPAAGARCRHRARRGGGRRVARPGADGSTTVVRAGTVVLAGPHATADLPSCS